MDKFQSEMNQTVAQFVGQIAELARRAVLDTIGTAFQQGTAATSKVATQVAPTAGRPRGTRGAKRTQEDVEATCNELESFVRANPGLRTEQINKQLGTTTKDLALPMRKLVAEGRVTTTGQRRATQYYPPKSKKK